MNFTKNETFSFQSFDECWDYWYKLSEENVLINMKQIFKIEDPFKGEGPRRKGKRVKGKGRRGDRNRKMIADDKNGVKKVEPNKNIVNSANANTDQDDQYS